jgi:hypothetical protein
LVRPCCASQSEHQTAPAKELKMPEFDCVDLG